MRTRTPRSPPPCRTITPRTQRLIDEVAELVERAGEPYNVARRWGFVGLDRRQRRPPRGAPTPPTRAAMRRWRACGSRSAGRRGRRGRGAHRRLGRASERALERVPSQLERALRVGAGMPVPFLMVTLAFAELAAGRLEQARERLEQLGRARRGPQRVHLVVGARHARRDAASARGRRARRGHCHAAHQRVGEGSATDSSPPAARLTLARLAAARERLAGRAAARARPPRRLRRGRPPDLGARVPRRARRDRGRARPRSRRGAAVRRGRARPHATWASPASSPSPTTGHERWSSEYDGAEGAALTIDDALEWARRARGPRTRPAAGWASLTPTEVRVVELVAQGLTNPQIAERMFISRETVKTHLVHAFAKLGVRNRTELAALAATRSRWNFGISPRRYRRCRQTSAAMSCVPPLWPNCPSARPNRPIRARVVAAPNAGPRCTARRDRRDGRRPASDPNTCSQKRVACVAPASSTAGTRTSPT